MNDWGDGAVVIWSFGLPFLPGYTSATRRGEAVRPRERPSLNVALYRGGELDFYLLQEYEPDNVTWDRDDDRWVFDRSVITSHRQGDRGRLDVELDCDIPGSSDRLEGCVSLEGRTATHDPSDPSLADSVETGSPDDEPSHDWSPRLVPAEGRVDLKCGNESYDVEGRAYHDCNGGADPFHELGIDRWIWGRAPRGDSEIVYYGLWPESEPQTPRCFAFRLDRSGHIERFDDLELDCQGKRRNPAGLKWFEHLAISDGRTFDLEIDRRSIVDNGPFYMRFVTEERNVDRASAGVGELIRPGRIDLARHRPFVRMRHHRKQGDNSMWLPLFSGSQSDRIGRLVRHVGGEVLGWS